MRKADVTAWTVDSVGRRVLESNCSCTSGKSEAAAAVVVVAVVLVALGGWMMGYGGSGGVAAVVAIFDIDEDVAPDDNDDATMISFSIMDIPTANEYNPLNSLTSFSLCTYSCNAANKPILGKSTVVNCRSRSLSSIILLSSLLQAP